MGANQGNYTRSGDPEAMFDEELRYLAGLMQAAVPVVDADLNDMNYALVAQLRRVIENAIGDGSPNDAIAANPRITPIFGMRIIWPPRRFMSLVW